MELTDEEAERIAMHLKELYQCPMPNSRSWSKMGDKFQIDVPDEAFFTALDDVPGISGRRIGATVFSGLMFLFIFPVTFIYPRRPDKKIDR